MKSAGYQNKPRVSPIRFLGRGLGRWWRRLGVLVALSWLPTACFLDPSLQCNTDSDCVAGARCQEHRCVCPGNLALCVSSTDISRALCVDRSSDAEHCGLCFRRCIAGKEYCDNGACKPCGEDTTQCDGRCVKLTTDRNHCGACGNACEVGLSCIRGACACPPGWANCGGQCVDVQDSTKHCGACNQPCSQANPFCVGGVCQPTCPYKCDGVCVDTQTNPRHCGACGKACGAGTSCCGGTCVDLQSQDDHCGQCHRSCSQGQICDKGACQCEAGTRACGQACVNVMANAAHCGACNKACKAGEQCSEGLCCPAGTTRCGATCVDLQTSRRHCGQCDRSCGNKACVTGQCQPCRQDADCGATLSCDASSQTCVCGPSCGWVQQAGGADAEIRPLALAADSQGELFLTGRWRGKGALGNQSHSGKASHDLFVAKLDALGQVLWLKVLDSSGDDRGTALAFHNKTLYVAGSFQGTLAFGSTTLQAKASRDVFVAALSPKGQWQWAQGVASGGDTTAATLAVDDQGRLYLAGTFTRSMIWGRHTLTASDGYDAFVGQIVPQQGGGVSLGWAVSPGGKSQARALVWTPQQTLALAGIFQSTISLSSTSTLDARGGNTLMVLRLNPVDGSLTHGVAGLGDVDGKALTVCDDGMLYVGGAFRGAVKVGTLVLQPSTSQDPGDMFVAELSPTLEAKRTLSYPDTGRGEVAALRCQGKKLWLGGTFAGDVTWSASRSASSQSLDGFVVRVERATGPSFGLEVALTVQGASEERLSSLLLGQQGGIFVAGWTQSDASFPMKGGTQALQRKGTIDGFVWKVAP